MPKLVHLHAMAARPPPSHVTERFRALRKRSGMTLGALAKAIGKAAASSLQRYEDPEAFTKAYFPRDLTERFAEVLAGKGEPPISRAEVLSLAGLDVLPETPPDEDQAGVNAQKVLAELGIPAMSREYAALMREIPKLHRLYQIDLSPKEAAASLKIITGIIGRVVK